MSIEYTLACMQGRVEQAICLDCGEGFPTSQSFICKCGGLIILVASEVEGEKYEDYGHGVRMLDPSKDRKINPARLVTIQKVSEEVQRLHKSPEARQALKDGQFRDFLRWWALHTARKAKGLAQCRALNPFGEDIIYCFRCKTQKAEWTVENKVPDETEPGKYGIQMEAICTDCAEKELAQ